MWPPFRNSAGLWTALLVCAACRGTGAPALEPLPAPPGLEWSLTLSPGSLLSGATPAPGHPEAAGTAMEIELEVLGLEGGAGRLGAEPLAAHAQLVAAPDLARALQPALWAGASAGLARGAAAAALRARLEGPGGPRRIELLRERALLEPGNHLALAATSPDPPAPRPRPPACATAGRRRCPNRSRGRGAGAGAGRCSSAPRASSCASPCVCRRLPHGDCPSSGRPAPGRSRSSSSTRSWCCSTPSARGMSPAPEGWVKLDLFGFELGGLRGLAAGSGVELTEGVYDARLDLLLQGERGLGIRLDNTIADLSLSEGADGPIARLLNLPAPLDAVLFLLRSTAGEHRVPLRFEVGSEGPSAAGLAAAALGTLSRVLADAVASSPLRVLGGVTQMTGLSGVLGGEASADPLTDLTSEPGTSLLEGPARSALAELAALLVAERERVAVLGSRLGSLDLERVERFANPSPEDVRALAAGLRGRRADLLARRGQAPRERGPSWPPAGARRRESWPSSSLGSTGIWVGSRRRWTSCSTCCAPAPSGAASGAPARPRSPWPSDGWRRPGTPSWTWAGPSSPNASKSAARAPRTRPTKTRAS